MLGWDMKWVPTSPLPLARPRGKAGDAESSRSRGTSTPPAAPTTMSADTRCSRRAARVLGPPVVRLEILVRDGPIVRDAVEAAKPKVIRVKPKRIALPVERAPPDPPRAPPLERVGHATPRRVSVELRVGAPPGI